LNLLKARIAALILAASATAAQAQTEGVKLEAAPRIALDRVLPKTVLASGSHRVLDRVKTRENWLEFEIESDFGSYKALSVPMLTLRVREIRTLAQAVSEYQRDNEKLAESLRGQLTVGADSFVDILTSPFSTTAQLVGQFGSNVAQTIDEFGRPAPDVGQQKVGENSFYHSLVPGDPILAAHKRNLASQLNLDLYSSNPKVQEFLNTVAAARSAGRQNAGVVTISLPQDQEIRIANGRVEAAARAAMTHNTINQLYARNFERLVSSGVDEDLANAFLSHPVLSPWHKTMLTERLVFLDGVENRGALLRAALSTRSEEQALAYLQVGKMLDAYQERSGSLRSLASAGHIVLATTRDGAILVLLPFDVLYWNREAAQIFSGLEKFARSKGFKRQTVISSSLITDSAQRGLIELGFEFEERFLVKR
jgi:hypothetical protein